MTEIEALATIQSGVAAASDGDTVLLLPGTYSGEGNHNVELLGKTISIVGRDGRDATIIAIERPEDCFKNPFERCERRAFAVRSGQGSDLRFEGLTIQDGVQYDVSIKNPVPMVGGAMLIVGSPTLVDCAFRDNLAAGQFDGRGGAISATGDPTFIRCIFEENRASYATGPTGCAFGGAIDAVGEVTLVDCKFIQNLAGSIDSCSYGGAVNASSVHATGSSFVENEAGPDGGRGGAIMAPEVVVDRCEFLRNVVGPHGYFTAKGGAIWSGRTLQVSNSLFVENEVEGVSYSDCSENTSGSAIHFTGSTDCASRRIVNSTFVGHNSDACPVAAVSVSYGSSGCVTVSNCIFADNEESFGLGVTAVLTNTIVEGGYPGAMDADPQFANAAGDDYRLSATSPGIDAGDNAAVLGTLDLDGNVRRFDDPATPDTGMGTAPIVDLGAYEFGAGPGGCSSADLAEPFGTLDFSDVSAFLTALATMSSEADLAEPFGTFDFSDVVAFLSAFDAGCP
ncbi:MAG: GC-type dockerin domain-anchored protein [Phycisphaerales bacterium JB059]